MGSTTFLVCGSCGAHGTLVCASSDAALGKRVQHARIKHWWPPICTSFVGRVERRGDLLGQWRLGEAGVALDAVERPFRTQHPLGVVVNRPLGVA